MQSKFSLIEGSIPRALLAFSLPILFGNILQTVNGSVNAVWVGKYLGETATGVTVNFLMSGSLIAILYLLNRSALELFLPANGAAIAIAAHLNAVIHYRFGGWRSIRLGIADAVAAPTA